MRKKKNKIFILFLAALILSIIAAQEASAAITASGISDSMKNVVGNVLSWYETDENGIVNSSHDTERRIVDFILMSIIFISIAVIGTSKAFKDAGNAAKALAIVIGLSMSLALVTYTKFSISSLFFPFASNLIFILIAMMFYGLFSAKGFLGDNKVGAAIMAIVVTYLSFNAWDLVTYGSAYTPAETARNIFVPGYTPTTYQQAMMTHQVFEYPNQVLPENCAWQANPTGGLVVKCREEAKEEVLPASASQEPASATGAAPASVPSATCDDNNIAQRAIDIINPTSSVLASGDLNQANQLASQYTQFYNDCKNIPNQDNFNTWKVRIETQLDRLVQQISGFSYTKLGGSAAAAPVSLPVAAPVAAPSAACDDSSVVQRAMAIITPTSNVLSSKDINQANQLASQYTQFYNDCKNIQDQAKFNTWKGRIEAQLDRLVQQISGFSYTKK